jgi:hypothetical protein
LRDLEYRLRKLTVTQCNPTLFYENPFEIRLDYWRLRCLEFFSFAAPLLIYWNPFLAGRGPLQLSDLCHTPPEDLKHLKIFVALHDLAELLEWLHTLIHDMIVETYEQLLEYWRKAMSIDIMIGASRSDFERWSSWCDTIDYQSFTRPMYHDGAFCGMRFLNSDS